MAGAEGKYIKAAALWECWLRSVGLVARLSALHRAGTSLLLLYHHYRRTWQPGCRTSVPCRLRVRRAPSPLGVRCTDPMIGSDAPAAIGPYEQAVKANGFVFVSGCIPLTPSSMQVVEGGFEEQMKQVLRNLRAVVEASGSSLNEVVKTTVSILRCAEDN